MEFDPKWPCNWVWSMVDRPWGDFTWGCKTNGLVLRKYIDPASRASPDWYEVVQGRKVIAIVMPEFVSGKVVLAKINMAGYAPEWKLDGTPV